MSRIHETTKDDMWEWYTNDFKEDRAQIHEVTDDDLIRLERDIVDALVQQRVSKTATSSRKRRTMSGNHAARSD